MTELENAASLQRFQLEETEKKKQTLKKSTYKGHYITYTSRRETFDSVDECHNYLTFTDTQNFYKVVF